MRKKTERTISIVIVLTLIAGIIVLLGWGTNWFRDWGRLKEGWSTAGTKVNDWVEDRSVAVQSAAMTSPGVYVHSDYVDYSTDIPRIGWPQIFVTDDGVLDIQPDADGVKSTTICFIHEMSNTTFGETEVVFGVDTDKYIVDENDTIHIYYTIEDIEAVALSDYGYSVMGAMLRVYCTNHAVDDDLFDSQEHQYCFVMPGSVPEYTSDNNGHFYLSAYMNSVIPQPGASECRTYSVLIFDSDEPETATRAIGFWPNNRSAYLDEYTRLPESVRTNCMSSCNPVDGTTNTEVFIFGDDGLNIALPYLFRYFTYSPVCTVVARPCFNLNNSNGSFSRLSYYDRILAPKFISRFAIAQLAEPQNVRYEAKSLKWDAVNEARGYEIFFEDATSSHLLTTQDTEIDLSEYNFSSGKYLFRIRATGNIGQVLAASELGEINAYNASANITQLSLLTYVIDGDVINKWVPQGNRLSDYLYDVEIENKTFGGWYYDNGFSRAVKDTDVIEGDVRVYARLTDVPVTDRPLTWWEQHKWAVLGPVIGVGAVIVVGVIVALARKHKGPKVKGKGKK